MIRAVHALAVVALLALSACCATQRRECCDPWARLPVPQTQHEAGLARVSRDSTGITVEQPGRFAIFPSVFHGSTLTEYGDRDGAWASYTFQGGPNIVVTYVDAHGSFNVAPKHATQPLDDDADCRDGHCRVLDSESSK